MEVIAHLRKLTRAQRPSNGSSNYQEEVIVITHTTGYYLKRNAGYNDKGSTCLAWIAGQNHAYKADSSWCYCLEAVLAH